VRWQPTPANFSSETKPTTLTLSADLIGRFDDAKQAEQAMHPGGPRGTVVASSTAVLTDDWSNRTATSIMRLRPGIATGFYIERMHLASDTLYGTGYCMLDLV